MISSQNQELSKTNAELTNENEKLKAEITALKGDQDEMEKEAVQLRMDRDKLQQHFKAVKFGAGVIEDNDDNTAFYTGLSSYLVFSTLFSLLYRPTSHSRGCKMTPMDELFIVLVKLRLNLLNLDIAYRMGCSESTVSRIFHKWLNILYVNLRTLIAWPEREAIRANLPEVFKENFRTVTCIVDCFEIFMERPLAFLARAQTYSNYKKHNTVKVFIAISPTGSIVFLSNAWGGRVSDKVITQSCGFLELLKYGDVCMADRGFNIDEDLAVRGAKLVIPAFTRGKEQLSREEVEKSRQISRVRIHVERVIGHLRKKYTILQGTLPITLIKKHSDTDVATIDKILVVTAALTNLSDSVVPE